MLSTRLQTPVVPQHETITSILSRLRIGPACQSGETAGVAVSSPGCRAPSRLLPTRRLSPRTCLTLRSEWSHKRDRAPDVILAGRATSVPFTTVLNGPEWTTTDNDQVASTCAVPHSRR
jgi:hypothetical protein